MTSCEARHLSGFHYNTDTLMNSVDDRIKFYATRGHTSCLVKLNSKHNVKFVIDKLKKDGYNVNEYIVDSSTISLSISWF